MGILDQHGAYTIRINHFSGSFRAYIEETLALGVEATTVEKHYNDVIDILSEKYDLPFTFIAHGMMNPSSTDYKELLIDCPMIPSDLEQFDENVCYRYNILPGAFKYFHIYGIFKAKADDERSYKPAAQ